MFYKSPQVSSQIGVYPITIDSIFFPFKTNTCLIFISGKQFVRTLLSSEYCESSEESGQNEWSVYVARMKCLYLTFELMIRSLMTLLHGEGKKEKV